MAWRSDKTPQENLEFFVSRLQNIQSAIPKEYKSEECLNIKLPNDMKYIEF